MKKANKPVARVAAKCGPKCGQCRHNEALPKSVRDARIEDLPDGKMLSLPKNLCAQCIDAIGAEIDAMGIT